MLLNHLLYLLLMSNSLIMAFKCVGPKSTTLTTAVPKVRDNPTSAADILQDIDVACCRQKVAYFLRISIL